MQHHTVSLRAFLVCAVLSICTMAIGLSLSFEALGQTATKPASKQDANQKPKQQPKKTKKPSAPFKWVNPLSEKEQEFPGLKHATFASPSLKTEVGYCIYLPPGYELFEFKEKRYPVIYYLHGGRPGSERKSVKLINQIDKHISARKVAPMIYVFVNGGPVSHYNMPNDP